jgi:DNA-binding transcriptional ArsR family regulator
MLNITSPDDISGREMSLRENNVSNHLAKLRDAGLVHGIRHETNGRFLYYERDEAALAAARAALDEILR